MVKSKDLRYVYSQEIDNQIHKKFLCNDSFEECSRKTGQTNFVSIDVDRQLYEPL